MYYNINITERVCAKVENRQSSFLNTFERIVLNFSSSVQSTNKKLFYEF